MENKDWIKFKFISENKFATATIDKCWGFQIQKNTKWNQGLTEDEINNLQLNIGLEFPLDYIEMLKVINGFDSMHISIDPNGIEEPNYKRRCYKYPEDLESTKYLIDEVNENIIYANEALQEAGFDSNQVESFIPLYGHRVLVVLKDKLQSPVISIWGSDIILYGDSLFNYWHQEFYIELD